eukprot:g1686.t1
MQTRVSQGLRIFKCGSNHISRLRTNPSFLRLSTSLQQEQRASIATLPTSGVTSSSRRRLFPGKSVAQSLDLSRPSVVNPSVPFLTSHLWGPLAVQNIQIRHFLRPDTTKKKFLKDRTGKLKQKETKAHKIQFGDYGIKSLEPARICNHQIEACVRTMRRLLSKQGILTLRIFPHFSVTKKPLAVRMGKGKGSISTYVAKVSRGTMLFELANVDEIKARKVLLSAGNKLPVKVKFVKRKHVV